MYMDPPTKSDSNARTLYFYQHAENPQIVHRRAVQYRTLWLCLVVSGLFMALLGAGMVLYAMVYAFSGMDTNVMLIMFCVGLPLVGFGIIFDQLGRRMLTGRCCACTLICDL